MRITDELRIRRSDANNLVLERFQDVTDKETREVKKKWKIVGYFRSVSQALQSILNNDLLINLDEVENLREYAIASKKQYETIHKLLTEGEI